MFRIDYPTRLVIAAATALLCSAAAYAGPTPAPVRAEIDALLARLQSSGCEFNRNGSWHKADAAKTHLLRKLEYIERKTTLKNAEQFIELAATSSSTSDKPYQVRCDGASPVPSARWLGEQLRSVRAQKQAAH